MSAAVPNLKSYTVVIHIVIIHIQVHTQSEMIYKRIHKFRNTINIDITIYNLQHTSSSCIICISN
jgi:hypothetical protein